MSNNYSKYTSKKKFICTNQKSHLEGGLYFTAEFVSYPNVQA